MKELINNEFTQVSFDKGSNAIVAIWKKPVTKEAYQFIFTAVLENFKAYRADSFISDINLQGLVDMESRQWLQSEILPKAYKAGLRNVAVVASQDVFSGFYIASIKKVMLENKMEVEFNDFQDVASAMDWVSHQVVQV